MYFILKSTLWSEKNLKKEKRPEDSTNHYGKDSNYHTHVEDHLQIVGGGSGNQTRLKSKAVSLQKSLSF